MTDVTGKKVKHLWHLNGEVVSIFSLSFPLGVSVCLEAL